MSLVKVFLTGNLTQAPETFSFQGDQKLGIKFSIAINRGYGDNKKTFFLSCVSFRQPVVKFMSEYCEKGNAVSLIGELEPNEYTSRDGVHIKTFQVIVDELEKSGPRPTEGTEAPAAQGQQQQRPAATAAPAQQRAGNGTAARPAQTTPRAAAQAIADPNDDDCPF